jgi:hypothetical protein
MRKESRFQIEFLNKSINRRVFASGSAAVAGGSLVGLPGRAQAQTGNPHFLLMMCISGGIDTSYLFDARPLAMTDKGKIQNYLYKNADSSVALPSDPSPIVMTGSNGGKTLRTSLTDPLIKYQSDFTVINGVGMDPNGFVGHGNNMYYLFTNSPNPGRDSWLPYIGATSNSPLEYVHIGGFEGDGNQAPTNFSGSIQLLPGQGGNLANALKNGPQIDLQSPLMKQIFARINANAAGAGIFSKGAAKMGAGLTKAPELAETLKKVSSGQGGTEFASALDLAIAYFRGGVTSSATIMYDRDPVLDTHGGSSAQKQPDLFKVVVSDLELLFKTLKETPFDVNAGLSFFDVTTVVITSEFSRTMRQNGNNIDSTGTDHNPLTNTVIVAGKGIKGGQVIGASDNENVDDASGELLNVSDAHKQKDPQLINIMGRPFDFATSTPRTDLPAAYDMKDYLLFPSIANTLMEMFKVPSQKHFRIGSEAAPIVKNLLK